MQKFFLQKLCTLITTVTINHTKEWYFQNTIKSNILTEEIRVLHVLPISDRRYNTCIESLNHEIRLL